MKLGLAAIVAFAAAPALACAVPDDVAGMRSALVDAGNAARAGNGREALGRNDTLARIAQDHACWMADTGNFSHEGKGGSSSADRARAAGYDYRFIAENIAFGQRTADQVVSGWMQSKGHRRNLLSPDAAETGIGIAANQAGRIYWVMSLGQTLPR